MPWLKITGWALFILPLLGFAAFAAWMILEVVKEDPNIKAFITVLTIAWLIGIVMLVLAYFPDFMLLFGFSS
ncbi:MAG: hypothetical protein V1664_04385 [Candidatus Uhrbacteria bacterium]